jgi:hypothetical protein
MNDFWFNVARLAIAGAVAWLVANRVVAVMDKRNSRWTGFHRPQPKRNNGHR